MHYYKKNIGDYHKKAGRLNMLQHGAYNQLIDSCYDRERFPTEEEAIDWVWASTTDEVEAVKFVLAKFFIDESGVFVQKRIKSDLAQYHKNADTNKRIAIDREAKRKNKSTNRVQVVDGAPQTNNEPPPNHKPLTTNQEPLTNLDIGKVSAKPKPRQQFTKPDLMEVYEYLVTRGINQSTARVEAEKFGDHYSSNGWKVGKNPMKDWKASVRNWTKNLGQQFGQQQQQAAQPRRALTHD
jgi:uncharacterized protein YdaU (DUF1376 family)